MSAPEDPAVSIESSITEHHVVVLEITIAADARAQDVADAITARTAAVDPAVSGIVAIHKLATLVIWIAPNATSTMASTVALTQCGRRNDHGEQ